MSHTTLVVRPDEPIGTISPRLYGHFAEHLGRCCYGGLWRDNEFRSDVVAALRELPVPLLRWPGGCYADHYHWRDGIGPAEQRPRRLGMSCGLRVEDDNTLGTHEFRQLCQQRPPVNSPLLGPRWASRRLHRRGLLHATR